ncbi:hypothetical protein [Kribbella sp. NPDC051718]|uniref:hypothetical protein n=1 Tax=Kribbella sp. NPDC051718 TaxID=3155168 RepID=UPI003428D164
MTVQPGPRPPFSRWPLMWTAIAFFAAGLVLSSIFLLQMMSVMPTEPAPLGDGLVQLDRDGLTISTTAQGQTPSCQAKDATGADIPLKNPLKRENYSVDGPSYYVIAHSRTPIPPQTVTVTCTNADNTIPYYVGDRAAPDKMFAALIKAFASIIVAVLIGSAFIRVEQLRHRRAGFKA